ncbi:MAG: single-stranded-DNA-specific exonuclease RecJ [Candidatus Viridilinea halotolerans]|uniref:Single-stranded-DNA-specific exonuclease RecJ n=1 Tax=Candidatus Viridilinea halotolerans TaxID=2491704 RepID=A0A426UAK6_9CHLR|nr:MAG: single-stranded-DNA-specific exonuclease RecJ [Candidatus Viridilinea halotolerans]
MSALRKHWEIRSPAPEAFISATGLSPLLANLLYHRDQRDPAAVAAFLAADARPTLHDPLLLRGMAAACERISRAIANAEPMAVYGDFDVDGVTAVTLLVQALSAMGATIRPYIPHRTREGYGLNRAAVSHLAEEGVRLLLTVDCGISNVEEVAEAQRLGLDVIVTDHHHPPATLPPALAIINPKQPECPYPFKDLVGVGIAYKLVQALVRRGHSLGGLRGRDLLDVVALGTVADMGPLRDENRVLVRLGLNALNTTQRPGIQALVRVAGLQLGRVTASDIGYMLGPRLNAAGRLDDAVRAYHLLLAPTLAEANTLADELNTANRERQALTKQVQESARELAAATGRDQQRIVVLADESFPAGVVGLVAGKLAEEWGRPVLLLERGPTQSRGSARSVPGFSLIEALTSCHELFVRFGGHAAAAGFTIENSKIPDLETRLLTLAAHQLSAEGVQPTLTIDATVPLDVLNWELLSELEQLEPFGQANPTPTLMSSGVTVVDARPLGAQGHHLRMVLRQASGQTVEAIAFRMGHLADALRRHPQIDVAYHLEVNEWNNERRLQLNVRDFRRAQPAGEG